MLWNVIREISRATVTHFPIKEAAREPLFFTTFFNTLSSVVGLALHFTLSSSSNLQTFFKASYSNDNPLILTKCFAKLFKVAAKAIPASEDKLYIVVFFDL